MLFIKLKLKALRHNRFKNISPKSLKSLKDSLIITLSFINIIEATILFLMKNISAGKHDISYG
jgi:hypothetical protein